jgi:hypothetical protein
MSCLATGDIATVDARGREIKLNASVATNDTATITKTDRSFAVILRRPQLLVVAQASRTLLAMTKTKNETDVMWCLSL